ncbi:MAG: thermosome subunit beta [Candidatus Thorarchaeota archaeon]
MSFGVPIIILKEGTEESSEKEARQQNINAMMAIAETVRTTLGPKGMAKMLVDSLGDTTITNDGAEILKALDLENVAAIMMVNIAKAIDTDIGDGTTSAVIFSAALLKNALELIEQDLHPKHITTGYKIAADKAIEIVNKIATKISKDDDDVLKNAAMTAMNAKDIAPLKDFFADLALKAVKQIADEKNTFDKVGNIKFIKAPGKSLKDSELINGVYIQKEKVNPAMPDILKNVKIAVLRKKLDVVKTESDAQIQIFSPADMQGFLDQEEKILQDYLKIFKELGVNMIINNKDISDKFGAYLAREGIAAIKNLGDSDIKAVLKAVEANQIDDLTSLTEADLGYAEIVKFEKIGNDEYAMFTGCKNPKSVSILLKGGLDKVLNSAEITLNDVLSVIAKTIDTQMVVAGGGAIYIELAKRIKDYANKIGGKEQIAVTAFALALEEIPKTLISNAGLDEIERLTELRAAHKTNDDKWIGIDTITNTIGNNLNKGIIEPAALITHLLKSGSELANLVLRVDRIIKASSAAEKGFQP